MLNRRILRIKLFKVLYSYAENPALTLKEAESMLEQSCEATRDLYLFLLALAGPLTSEAKARMESARSKFNPTEAELNPNCKFIENRIAPLLEEDPDFKKLISSKKMSWDQYDAFLRHLFENVRDSEYYAAYMQNPERSLKEDARLFGDIYAAEFEDNSELEEILEDLSILWNDDLVYSVNVCIRTFDELGRGRRWSLPDLYMSDVKSHGPKESDKAFITKVLRNAVANFDKYYQDIAATTPKWDKSRICATDLALIVCGLAEASAFPDMPAGIIINEYVEISKFYSTAESRGFVNGVLDKLINKK